MKNLVNESLDEFLEESEKVSTSKAGKPKKFHLKEEHIKGKSFKNKRLNIKLL